MCSKIHDQVANLLQAIRGYFGSKVFNKYNGNDKHVVIPEGITTIAEGAFRGKPILSVQIPDSVQVIGARAFSETALEEIILPRSLKFLQCGTFYGCKNLRRVVLPEGLIGIGESVFERCKELRSLIVPDSVQVIGARAFTETALEEIILPRSLKFLQCETFYYCGNLHRVVLPEGLIGIGKDVFKYCGKLKDLTVPDSVRYLYGSYFDGEKSITEHSIETYGGSVLGNLPEVAERLKALYDTVNVAIPEAAKNKLDFGRFTFYYERTSWWVPGRPSITETLKLGEEETVLHDVKGQNHLQSIIDIPTFDEYDRMYSSYVKMLLLRESGNEGLTAVVEKGGYEVSSYSVYRNVYPGNGKTRYFLEVMGIY
ncbi:leucine-rich repeat domain-containing protein [bacterium]|nr:leucine-rich repeat domain-containing protein [bacterium]